jgi:NAD(P)-dependent dehydrogenase (short-subunit alcohol dehydrogenase family)
MRGKTIVITGATSGIGAVAAMRLAEQGARMLFTARDRARADATLAQLHQANDVSAHQYFLGDLSLLAEQKRLAREIGAAVPSIDVLINNAGALFNRRSETADGLEKTFALNHMSYFTLTQLLLPQIVAGGRIVNTASRAHRNARLDFGDLQSRRGYVGFLVYSRSKLCNILFTRELARRLPRGITANALHPGFVATRFGDQSGTAMQQIVALAKRFGAITPEEGAKTLIFLAGSADVKTKSGRYFARCREELPSSNAQNDADATRLWEISRRIFEGEQ